MVTNQLERTFWRYWLGGILLLAAMIVMNIWLMNDVSPLGIRNHQSAGTAAQVDAIQAAWQATGMLGWARFGMVVDLIYIAIYSFGAYCGGRLFIQNGPRGLSRLGWLIVVAAILLTAADYIETICQFIQIIQAKGSDRLAQVAATAQPIKSLAFITTFIGITAGLFFRRMTSRRA